MYKCFFKFLFTLNTQKNVPLNKKQEKTRLWRKTERRDFSDALSERKEDESSSDCCNLKLTQTI